MPPNPIKQITGITGPFKLLFGVGDGGGSFPEWRRLRGCLRKAMELEGPLGEHGPGLCSVTRLPFQWEPRGGGAWLPEEGCEQAV